MGAIELNELIILVVEDEYLVARPLCRLLSTMGAKILGPAATVEQSLSLLATADRIDFGLIDINLRGTPAFPIAHALSERGVRFAFATGYGDALIPERFRDIPILQKPFGAAAVANVLLTPIA